MAETADNTTTAAIPTVTGGRPRPSAAELREWRARVGTIADRVTGLPDDRNSGITAGGVRMLVNFLDITEFDRVEAVGEIAQKDGEITGLRRRIDSMSRGMNAELDKTHGRIAELDEMLSQRVAEYAKARAQARANSSRAAGFEMDLAKERAGRVEWEGRAEEHRQNAERWARQNRRLRIFLRSKGHSMTEVFGAVGGPASDTADFPGLADKPRPGEPFGMPAADFYAQAAEAGTRMREDLRRIVGSISGGERGEEVSGGAFGTGIPVVADTAEEPREGHNRATCPDCRRIAEAFGAEPEDADVDEKIISRMAEMTPQQITATFAKVVADSAREQEEPEEEGHPQGDPGRFMGDALKRISPWLAPPQGLHAFPGRVWPGVSGVEVLTLRDGSRVRLIGVLAEGEFRRIVEGAALPFPLDRLTGPEGLPVWPSMRSFVTGMTKAAELGLRFEQV